MKVGFIGLGIMGRPLAGHLLKGGYQLSLFDLGGLPQELVDGDAVGCASGRDVAERSDVIITMVPDTPHVEAALFGGNGVADGLRPGKIVVDMSSISPIATKDFAKRINGTGCDYLDAPVSGGEAGAQALLFASKAGADPRKVRQALMGGFASSRILEVHGERMINRTFDPGFRIELHQKDLNLALQSAKALKLSLPNTATAQELFNACAAHGGAAWDHSAMVRALEIMANHEIGARPADATLPTRELIAQPDTNRK